MLPDADNSISNVDTAQHRLPEKLPPCTSGPMTSPKTHELRTRYEASHANDAEPSLCDKKSQDLQNNNTPSPA
jgi:hypothetical protein